MDDSSPGPVATDLLFDALADDRRRRVLKVLRDEGRAHRLFLDDIATRLVDREPGGTESTERISVALHHAHIPNSTTRTS